VPSAHLVTVNGDPAVLHSEALEIPLRIVVRNTGFGG
jgi:hypothetical protein